jgi:hypothetical protein
MRIPYIGFLIAFINISFPNIYSQTKIEQEIISSVINEELQAELNLHHRDTIFNKKGQIKRIKGFTFSSIYLGDKTVIEHPIHPDTLSKYCIRMSLEIDQEIFHDFIINNLEPIKLDSLYDLHFQKKSIPKNFMGNGHNPIINVSRPGINKMKDKAFIYYSRRWGPLSGYGGYYLLQKTSEGWKIKATVLAWIS